jgi:predicted nucleic acid-binding protein
MIVSDAGPIIIFARIGKLSLLHQVTGALLIPDAVYNEIVLDKGGMPGASEVAQARWIQKTQISDRSTINDLPRALHEGEREAITLAKEKRAQLLIDELRARRIASNEGIEVIGTLGILAEAKLKNVISAARPVIEEMQSRGYRFDRALIRGFLDLLDER